MSPRYWFINRKGVDVQLVQDGLDWLLRTANSQGAKAMLAVPTLGAIPDTGFFARAFGKDAVRQLRSAKTASVKGVTLSLLTEKLGPHSWDGPVLAFSPSARLLDKIDSLLWQSTGVTDMLVIPRDQAWIERTGAREPGTEETDVSTRATLPMEVEVALNWVHNPNDPAGLYINRDDDADSAVDLLIRLWDNGTRFNIDTLRAELVGRGVDPILADRIRRKLQGHAAGKKVRYRRGPWEADVVDRLKEEARRRREGSTKSPRVC